MTVHACKSNDAREAIRALERESLMQKGLSVLHTKQKQRPAKQKGAYSPHHLYLIESDSTEDEKSGLNIKEIIVLVLILCIISVLALQNLPLNSLISGSPYKGCNVDSDCVLKVTTCHACSCKDAVNKEWKLRCLIKSADVSCKPCASSDQLDVKCIKNQCQKVWK